MRLSTQQRSWRSGFSLIEVVVATGLCTYALVIIACLLPMGLGTVQIANAQIVETEIFNRIWLEVNTIPYYSLPTYQRFKGGAYPDNSTNGNGLSYFDKDGAELGQNTNASVTVAAPSGVYYVYCTMINFNLVSVPATVSNNLVSSRLKFTGPPVDGIGTSNPGNEKISVSGGTAGSGLNLVKISIGFHVDPTTAGLSATDPRVTSRTFVIAKRDTANGQ